MRHRSAYAAAVAATLLALAVPTRGAIAQDGLLFWSTQAKPVEETQRMRDGVLATFGKPVDYQPQDVGPFLTRIQAELQAGSGEIDVLGGLHGDFTAVPDGLVDLSDVAMQGKPTDAFMALGKLGTAEQKYLPWMQASYVMVANKKALEHLPAGADINALSYDQLIEWSKNLAEKTGGPKFGFPAGPKALKHRFFQGFLYPSYTKSAVTKFRSPEAETAWNKFKELWQYTNPASTGYNFMQEPLLSEDVWVAWDHIARLADAINQRPDDFVVFPVPAGPMGRGFMPVLAGVAVPKTAADPAAAKELVAFMLKPETQIATLKATNFFPVTDVALPADLPASAKAFQPVIAAQTSAADAVPTLVPMGLKDQGGKFNQAFTDTFERIVLNGQDTRTVLDEQAQAIKAIIDATGAPCWAPDPKSDGPCPVE